MSAQYDSFLDTATLKKNLVTQLPRVVSTLFVNRTIHRSAHEYRIGNQGSISIRLSDGNYFDHESSEGGDVLHLIQRTLRTDFKGALVWARGFVGRQHTSPRPAPPSAPLEQKKDERAARQRSKALVLMKRATPIAGTLAERYLRDMRGITLSPIPTSLGFVAHAHNFTAGGFHPAMVAPISNLDGDIIAAHCTFLDPTNGNKLHGDGVKSRLIFGACRGGAIRLTEATDRLALCEGIEDGLSILQCAPDWSVWVTGGTSNLRAVQVPSHVREVMVCADSDDAGRAAAHDLSQRLVSEGKRVRVAFPPQGFKDFNDVLRHGGHHV